MNGTFVWTDLSTFDVEQACADYSQLFCWDFGEGSYRYATASGQPIAAVYEMPMQLQKLNLPSFWMSYVGVDDIDASLDVVGQFPDAKVELGPQAFEGGGRIALVRDPAGAGFTLYEGPNIEAAPLPVARFLHVLDVSQIDAFYRALFGWRCERRKAGPWAASWPQFDILHPDGQALGLVEEVPEDIRGKFQYWMPGFARAARDLNDDTFATFSDLPGNRRMVEDRQGAHFLLVG